MLVDRLIIHPSDFIHIASVHCRAAFLPYIAIVVVHFDHSEKECQPCRNRLLETAIKELLTERNMPEGI